MRRSQRGGVRGVAGLQGVALRCAPCGALLLNAQAYKTHMQSRKHRKHLQGWAEDEPAVVFAADAPAPTKQADEGETHAERLQRLKQQLAADAAKQPGATSAKHNKKTRKQEQPQPQQEQKKQRSKPGSGSGLKQRPRLPLRVTAVPKVGSSRSQRLISARGGQQ
ncbi:hypothetical protein COO60DRAFT_1218068 [Scenedesmus sp. NREL 46B-D3]|nr:hypothetical protein COO60DRAFT_1218068 [Scenedesmus sp. NREL 46B-D3]